MAAQPEGIPAPADGSLPETAAAISRGKPFSLYLHVPFCLTRCGYCDFNTYTQTELPGVSIDEYADVLVRELIFAERVLKDSGVESRPIDTVFIGGGTPTLLAASDLGQVLTAARELWGFRDGIEITVEANPDTVTQQTFEDLRSFGVNRVSIGMQSAVPSVLKTLDRTHHPDNVTQAIRYAKAVGLSHSLDLIYGAPGEAVEDWKCSLDAVIELEPDHVSTYALIVEEGTKLARQIRRGEVPEPDADRQADMYELADTMLSEAGYDWYELSNWSKGDAHRSQHNLNYWTGAEWWGAGPGAHSSVGGVRWWNVKHPTAWGNRIASHESPAFQREILTEEQQQIEDILLKTRLREGMAIDELPGSRTGVAELIADGLISPADAFAGRVVPTLKGRLLADRIVHALLS